MPVLETTTRSTYDWGVTPAQEAAERALEDVADALRDAQQILRIAETSTRMSLRENDGSGISAEVLRSAPVNEVRNPVDEALGHLERCRHAVLVAIFAVALEDGMSIGELSRNYGFSRQRAARYAKEALSLKNGATVGASPDRP